MIIDAVSLRSKTEQFAKQDDQKLGLEPVSCAQRT